MRIRWVLMAVVGVAGCEAGDDGRCAPGGIGQQPVGRFLVGHTLALPAVEGGEACAAGWTLAAAPEGNRNTIEGGRRFTPHLTGDYHFRIDATGEEQALHVIDAAPFHNLHYYPGQSIAAVGDAVWTADVYRPTLTAFDPVGGATDTIAVGSWPVAIAWRPGMAHAVVAQRGSDDLALVDVATHRIVDAIPVGDEPANVVASPDGATAYVALAVSGDVAVVDLASRAVTRRIPLVPDIRALALSPDGAQLYAARLRSGHPVRAPYPDTPLAEERDIIVVDLATGQIARELIDVGAMIKHLAVSADGATLVVSRLRNDTLGSLADGGKFIDEIALLDAATGAPRAVADIGRQASSAGFAVTVQGFAIADGHIWLASEGSDVVVVLDAATLAEVGRVPAPGRPRAVAITAAGVHVHGPQAFAITTIPGGDPAAAAIVTSTGADPRPPDVARGQQLFTGAGESYGADHACQSCHAEGATDTQVWRFGQGEYAVPRPQFFLEGTAPLGWPAYLSDVRNFAYGVGPTIGIRPDTGEAEALGAFLASLMPPPAANDWTLADGALSADALRGKALFEGVAGCDDCHRGPVFTSRRTLPDGITAGPRDVPSLVGAYRHNVWFKSGEARTLRDAVAAMAAWSEAALTEAQIDDVTRYVKELTGRDFFVLTSAADSGGRRLGSDRPLTVTFSLPVWTDPGNLARIRLVDGGNQPVATTVTADNRHVTLTPVAPLAFEGAYRLVIDAGFESFDQRTAAAAELPFTVAAAPRAALDGAYTWTVMMPAFDRSGGFDPTRTVPVAIPVTASASASGATLTFDLGQGLTYTRHAVIDGDVIALPAMPVPVGPNLADARLEDGVVVDRDGDGMADALDGALRISGPGFDVADIAWTVAAPAAR
jgi:YVTN family beta-propeller protein